MNAPPTVAPAAIAVIVGHRPSRNWAAKKPSPIVYTDALTVNQNGSSPRALPWRAEPGIGLVVYCSTTSLIPHRSPAARPCGRFSHAGRARGAASGSHGSEQAEGHRDPGEDRTGPQRAGRVAGQRSLERGHRPVPR